MRRPRRTKAERRQEREAAERRCWESFFPRLQAVQTDVEAVQLLNEAPPEGAPGRRYYSNLGWFMRTFSAPDGASYSENAQYLRILALFDASGLVKPGFLTQLEDSIKHRMADQNRF